MSEVDVAMLENPLNCESKYSKTGDFILDLYWCGCRGDWPRALHMTNKLVIGFTC